MLDRPCVNYGLDTLSAIFGGDDLIASSDEIPYPRRHVDLLSAAIAKTEKAVLDANVNRTVDAATKTGLSTCSIRAATVYGPRDQIFLPGLAYRARSGASFIGDGNNMVDFVFAGNVAHALVLTAQQLLSNQSAAADNKSDGDPAGRALFITDAEPVPFGDFARRVLSGLGYPASAKGLSVQYAVVLAVLLRLLSILISSFVAFQPAVTAQRVAEESRTRRFDVSGAKKVLGYAPLWSQEVGSGIEGMWMNLWRALLVLTNLKPPHIHRWQRDMTNCHRIVSTCTARHVLWLELTHLLTATGRLGNNSASFPIPSESQGEAQVRGSLYSRGGCEALHRR